MNEIKTPNDHEFECLRNEYAFLSDYIKYIYEVRDRYIKFLSGAIVGVGIIFGYLIKNKKNGELDLIFAILAPIIFFIFLNIFMFYRTRTVEYKNHLNLVRSRLCDISGIDKKFKENVLYTKANIKTWKQTSAEVFIIRIIEVIIVISILSGIYIIKPKLLSWHLCLSIPLIFSLELYWNIFFIIKDKNLKKELQPNAERNSQQRRLKCL